MVYQNILEAVGNTPMVELNRMTGPEDARVLVKYEGMNIGGSIKTRTALKMIEEAEKRGDLHKDSIIVEPTSGNQGIGLALVGAVKGYKTIIIMPDSVSVERRYLVSQYGAEVKLVHDAGNIGKCIEECIELAAQMAAENEKVFVPNQFENADNVAAHLENTGLEILRQVDGPIDAFCSGIGTGGTITGIGRILKGAKPDIRICACEPDRHPSADGYRRRRDSRDPGYRDLFGDPYRDRCGGDFHDKRAGREGRDPVRYFQRNECQCCSEAGQGAGQRKNGRYGSAGYRRALFQHHPLWRLREDRHKCMDEEAVRFLFHCLSSYEQAGRDRWIF